MTARGFAALYFLRAAHWPVSGAQIPKESLFSQRFHIRKINVLAYQNVLTVPKHAHKMQL